MSKVWISALRNLEIKAKDANSQTSWIWTEVRSCREMLLSLISMSKVEHGFPPFSTLNELKKTLILKYLQFFNLNWSPVLQTNGM